MRNISNSEANTWQQCKRRYFYQFDLQLAPLKDAEALEKGTKVHGALEMYYTHLMHFPGDFTAAVVEGNRYFQKCLMNGDDLAIIAEAKVVYERYCQLTQGDMDWEILEVEMVHHVPLTERFNFTFKLDMLARNRRNNRVAVWDHKTAYNFWSVNEVATAIQLPKYALGLKLCGIPVDDTIINQIRTRDIKSQLKDDNLRRVVEDANNPQRQASIMRDQIVLSMEIADYLSNPPEVRERMAVRSMDKNHCKYCPMIDLCVAEQTTGEQPLMRKEEYKPNTYGYNKDHAAVLAVANGSAPNVLESL